MKSMTKFIVVFTVSIAGCTSAQAEPLDGLNELIGCWQVQAKEENSLGEFFEQSGYVNVTSPPGSGHIFLVHHLNITVAEGMYEDIAKERVISEVMTYDANSHLLTISVSTPRSPTPKQETAAISADGRVIVRTFMFYHPRREITLIGRDTIRRVAEDEVSQITEINDAFGEYRETYSSTWRLSPDRSTPCDGNE